MPLATDRSLTVPLLTCEVTRVQEALPNGVTKVEEDPTTPRTREVTRVQEALPNGVTKVKEDPTTPRTQVFKPLETRYARVQDKYLDWFHDNSNKYLVTKLIEEHKVEALTRTQLNELNTAFFWELEQKELNSLFKAFDTHDGEKKAGEGDNLINEEEFKGLVGLDRDSTGASAWEKIAVTKKVKMEEAVEGAKLELFNTVKTKTNGPQRSPEEIGLAGRAFNQKIEDLQNLWRNMTPHMFKKILHLFSVFENDPVEFLQSFTLQVYRTTKPVDGEIDAMPQLQMKIGADFDVMMTTTDRGYGWDGPETEDWKAALRKAIEGVAGNTPCPYTSCWTKRNPFLRSRSPQEYRFMYTTAAWMFDPNHQREFAGIVKTISDMGVASGVYGTFAVRGHLLQAWHCVEDLFIAHVIMDAYFIGVFMKLGLDGRDPEGTGHHPSYSILVLVLVGFVRSVLCIVVEVGAAYDHCFCNVRLLLRDYFSHPQICFSVVMQLFEVYVPFSVMLYEFGHIHYCTELYDDHFFDSGNESFIWHSVKAAVDHTSSGADGPHKDCGLPYVQKHPVFLAYLVGTKCLMLLQYLLATRFLGEQVIPAYNALMDPSHKSFMVFLMLVVMSCFSSYFMFPIKTGSVDDVLWTFMSMFRLAIPGDFDLGDLEGANGVVYMDKNGSDLNEHGDHYLMGETDDGEFNAKWHHGMYGFFMIITIIVNVMLLNVYIGLLSELYNGYADKKAQHFEHFRGHISWKLLLARHGWRYLVSKLTCKRLCSDGNPYTPAIDSVTYNQTNPDYNQPNKETHIWIAYNPAVFKDEKDETKEAYGKIDKIYDMLLKLQNEVNDLKEVKAATEVPPGVASEHPSQ